MEPGEFAYATVKLLLACAFGGLVGWQREAQDRPAGFRTHILVCVGSCLLMIVSFGVAGLSSPGRPSDPGRIAAQVVSGIGFLGAGTIIRQGSVVRGLTTAASLWTVAAVGLATGMGGAYALLAGVTTLLVLVTLTLFSMLERRLLDRGRALDVDLVVTQSAVGDALERLLQRGVRLGSIQRQPDETEEGLVRIRLSLFLPPEGEPDLITQCLAGVQGVRAVRWD